MARASREAAIAAIACLFPIASAFLAATPSIARMDARRKYLHGSHIFLAYFALLPTLRSFTAFPVMLEVHPLSAKDEQPLEFLGNPNGVTGCNGELESCDCENPACFVLSFCPPSKKRTALSEILKAVEPSWDHGKRILILHAHEGHGCCFLARGNMSNAIESQEPMIAHTELKTP